MTYCHEKNDLFRPFLDLLQIFHVLSVGLVYFYVLRPEFPIWQCLAAQRDSSTVSERSDSTSLDVAVVIRAVRL